MTMMMTTTTISYPCD